MKRNFLVIVSAVFIGLAILALFFVMARFAEKTKQIEITSETVSDIMAPAGKEELVYLKVSSARPSSFEETPDWAPKPDPMAPVDGDLDTRWSPKLGLDNEWIQFDFGKPKTVSKIAIRWEQAYAVDYEILISDDLKTWKQVALLQDQDGDIDEIVFRPLKARYVKIIGLKRNNPKWGFSIWEFEMYGPKSLNPQDRPLEEVFPSRGVDKIEEWEFEVPTEPLPSPGLIEEEFQKGVVYTSWSVNELATSQSDSTLKYLYDKNVKHVALLTTYFQDNLNSTEIYPLFGPDGKTPSDETLIHAISVIHHLGMKVMLKPHLDSMDGEARQDIMPFPGWFERYKNFILHYAELASEYDVELFCVGTELKGTTLPEYENNWREIIREVREVYKGPLVYGANWDEYMYVPFWDAVDFVGIDAYFPLTEKNDPTKEELIAAWEGQADIIENWLKSKGINQPVIFTEIGYDTVDGSNTKPWRLISTRPEHIEDQDEQADCLDAMVTVLSERSWFRGFYWWNYFPRPGVGALGFTLRGKKGEEVLDNWFKKL